ncbi:hypothetical protein VNO78_11380 [Psophocarpus tetragonolobus]|uniref:Secreted protein n=1 Tax=Psophocarpus tetragonolobus TaxID=3891 RepID=A0AAN9XNM3_PSOTE
MWIRPNVFVLLLESSGLIDIFVQTTEILSSQLQLHYRASSPLAGVHYVMHRISHYHSVQFAKGELPSDFPATLLR